MSLCYFDYYHQLEEKLRIEEPLMLQAGTWIAKQINQGGRLQIYASRTLSGVAFEFWDQTPDLVPSILIENPAGGVYETLEGAGQAIIDQLSVKSEDIFLLLSNEGRNPAIIELAQWIKENGHPLIIVTDLICHEVSNRNIAVVCDYLNLLIWFWTTTPIYMMQS